MIENIDTETRVYRCRTELSVTSSYIFLFERLHVQSPFGLATNTIVYYASKDSNNFIALLKARWL